MQYYFILKSLVYFPLDLNKYYAFFKYPRSLLSYPFVALFFSMQAAVCGKSYHIEGWSSGQKKGLQSIISNFYLLNVVRNIYSRLLP